MFRTIFSMLSGGRFIVLLLFSALLAGKPIPALPADSIRELGDAPPVHTGWRETNWPFPLDQWGTGRAFECRASDCGTRIDLYLRPKLGFCNCATGIVDDQELDRVGDLELLSTQFVGLADGRMIDIAGMSGRSRAYQVNPAYGPPFKAVAIAFNHGCDVMVATVIGSRDPIADVASTALAFLNSRSVVAWAEKELGK